MSSALVSAVIPTYNYGRFVVEALESALGQTHANMEVIVVDDGSTDDTRERLGPYMHRVRYVYQDNRGLSAARNTGVREARGDWVAFLDSDDVWHPQKIEVQLGAVTGLGPVGLIGSPRATELPERLAADPEVRRLGVRDLMAASLFGPSSVLIRRDCFEEVGYFDEGLNSVEDRDMWLRVADRFPAVLVSSPCWWYRLHGNQMNKNPERMYRNYCHVLKNFFQKHPEHSGLKGLAWGYLYHDAAVSYSEAGRRAAAIKFTLKSMTVWPQAFGDRRTYKPWLRGRILTRLLLGDRVFHSLLRVAGNRRQHRCSLPGPGVLFTGRGNPGTGAEPGVRA